MYYGRGGRGVYNGGVPIGSLRASDIRTAVDDILRDTPAVDIHTHLFAPSFGRLALWGIDQLLTYHYLEAELFRFSDVRPEQYWALDAPQRADLVWNTLFLQNSPVSEATRGVIAVLTAFGLDPTARSLEPFRSSSARTWRGTSDACSSSPAWTKS